MDKVSITPGTSARFSSIRCMVWGPLQAGICSAYMRLRHFNLVESKPMPMQVTPPQVPSLPKLPLPHPRRRPLPKPALPHTSLSAIDATPGPG